MPPTTGQMEDRLAVNFSELRTSEGGRIGRTEKLPSGFVVGEQRLLQPLGTARTPRTVPLDTATGSFLPG